MEPTTQMVHDQQQPKWEGVARAELLGPEEDQVWPLLEDFFGLHKWSQPLPLAFLYKAYPDNHGVCALLCRIQDSGCLRK